MSIFIKKMTKLTTYNKREKKQNKQFVFLNTLKIFLQTCKQLFEKNQKNN